MALPKLLYNSCFGAWETGPGSRWGRYELNSGGLVLPRPGSVGKTHCFPSPIPWAGGRTLPPRQGVLPAPPNTITPRYCHVSLVCGKKCVPNPTGPPPSTEKAGPLSQVSQTSQMETLLCSWQAKLYHGTSAGFVRRCEFHPSLWPLLSSNQFCRDTIVTDIFPSNKDPISCHALSLYPELLVALLSGPPSLTLPALVQMITWMP